jgi:hypothetical protein
MFSFVLDTLLLLKEGSYSHYALTTVAFGSVLIGHHSVEMNVLSRRFAPAALAVVALVITFPAFVTLRNLGWRPLPAERPAQIRAAILARPESPLVLTDGGMTGFAVGAGATPMVADSFALMLLDEQHRIELEPLLAALRDGRVTCVLFTRPIAFHLEHVGTPSQLWPKAVLDTVAAYYEEAGGVPGVSVYRPRR